MKILITGGLGFMGSNLCEYLLERHPEYEIVIYDALTYAGRIENIKHFRERVKVVIGDIRNQVDVFKAIKDSDVVYHLAAASHVDRSIENPEPFMTTEFIGTYNLLEALRKYDKKLIHISTCEVYGEALETPMTEEHPLNPRSPYAASKCGADRLCYSYHITYGVPVTIVRPFNNYGKRQFPEKLIPNFITRAILNKKLPVYGKGEATRDWLYVEDFCCAMEMLIDKNLKGETINLGAGNERSVIQIATLVLSYLKKDESLIEYVKDRPGNVPRFLGSYEKAQKLLGWKPETVFEDGLKKTVKWYVSNEWWWKPLVVR
ncbi:MAG: dTDP-glucose 4,6-dehydratase [Candidatus Methanofastidiosia archaeon]